MNGFARPSEQTIRFSCGKLVLLFAPLGFLVVLSVLVNPEAWRTAPLWAYLVFADVALLLVFACLVLPRRHFLHLTPEGLVIQYIASRRPYSWDEIYLVDLSRTSKRARQEP